MDLSTRYLGLRLKDPLMVGASPMVDDLDTVRRLEEAGAAAIVMHSLFEEQLTGEQLATVQAMEYVEGAFAEAQSFLPAPAGFARWGSGLRSAWARPMWSLRLWRA